MTSLLLGLALAATGGAEVPAAMVLDVKGKVVLERAKEPARPLGVMAILRPGDRIRSSDGEVTLMLLGDGRREALRRGNTATVQAKGCAPADAVEALKAAPLPPAHLESLRELTRSARGGVSKLRGPDPETPQRVTPLYGARVRTDRPALDWTSHPKADAYLVQMFSGVDGPEKRLLWKAMVKKPGLSYPEKEKPLEWGSRYRWRVTPITGDELGETLADSIFQLPTKAELAELAGVEKLKASKKLQDRLLAALWLHEMGIYDEALALFESLQSEWPDQPLIYATLASYYTRAGQSGKAKAAQEKGKILEAP